jgi:hypothetical protein
MSCVRTHDREINNPYYHDGSLVPGGLNYIFWVLTPALYAKKGFWDLQHLGSCVTRLLAKAFSEEAVAKLEGLELNSICLGSLLPGKCLVHGFEALSDEGGLKNEIGGVCGREQVTDAVRHHPFH